MSEFPESSAPERKEGIGVEDDSDLFLLRREVYELKEQVHLLEQLGGREFADLQLYNVAKRLREYLINTLGPGFTTTKLYRELDLCIEHPSYVPAGRLMLDADKDLMDKANARLQAEAHEDEQDDRRKFTKTYGGES